ncbi:porin [Ferrigenium kumadai]|uniref:Porin n=1 Tax=Ferrigenium kumadai TaxID=1682490 RepID=A0AAN1SXQ9_9PROT|nr:porin [Ferrigenium kumadai]BBI98501.1 porin [Ferrigenium kumadai]
MQKKIIALAIAAAVSAPAFADTSNVTVYGVANVSYDMTRTGNNTAGVAGFSNNKVSSNTSRLGLKGSEDLGDGLSAIWQIETLIQIDGGACTAPGVCPAQTLANRNTFAGLSSTTAGTVLLGRHDTPYKIATRAMDVFGDQIADNRSIMGSGGASFDGRQPDVVAYISPAMSGFTGAIAYVAGAESQTATTQTKGSAWSLAGLYGNGPLNINAGYEVHNIGSAAGSIGIVGLTKTVKETAWKIGASYTIDAFTINGVYEKTSDDFGGQVALGTALLPAGVDVLGHNAYYLSGKYAFGSNAVKLAYTHAGNLNMGGTVASANTGANQISVGFDHNLSKRTTVYALYTQLNNKSAGAYTLGNASIGNGAVFNNGAGSKPSAVSLGMKHTF